MTTKVMNINEIEIGSEYYRINSYYWQNMVYVALSIEGSKVLCQIKGSKTKPKYIPVAHLSKEIVDFKQSNNS